mmetsp:Transcript_13533/g.28452  ORF Transcript_13533/g.28452 Transcript_13533/m.28452 type:complete len:306 (-) Transcript_13533:1061-1978(-)
MMTTMMMIMRVTKMIKKQQSYNMSIRKRMTVTTNETPKKGRRDKSPQPYNSEKQRWETKESKTMIMGRSREHLHRHHYRLPRQCLAFASFVTRHSSLGRDSLLPRCCFSVSLTIPKAHSSTPDSKNGERNINLVTSKTSLPIRIAAMVFYSNQLDGHPCAKIIWWNGQNGRKRSLIPLWLFWRIPKTYHPRRSTRSSPLSPTSAPVITCPSTSFSWMPCPAGWGIGCRDCGSLRFTMPAEGKGGARSSRKCFCRSRVFNLTCLSTNSSQTRTAFPPSCGTTPICFGICTRFIESATIPSYLWRGS